MATQGSKEQATTKPEKPIEVKKSSASGSEWDPVDEAVWESFPASDPPAHWAGADKKPTGEAKADEVESKKSSEPAHREQRGSTRDKRPS